MIDVLVNNAGVYKVKRQETDNGIEMSFAVNFLATFMLSQMLLDRLEASQNGRIVNVVSEMYKKGTINFDNLMLTEGYKVGDAYANSKLAAVLYTAGLAGKVKDTSIRVNALHPGVLATEVFRDYPALLTKILSLFLEKPYKGGQRIAYLAVSGEVKDVSGKYFYKTEEREIITNNLASDTTEKLWQLAEEFTGMA